MIGVNWYTKDGRYAGPPTEPPEPTREQLAEANDDYDSVIAALDDAIVAGLKADIDTGELMKAELEQWKQSWADWLDAQR